MNGEEISEMYQEMVRDSGDMVDIDTARCVIWKADHPNCSGCESDLGCCKAVALMLVSMKPMMYEPRSYQDFEDMNKSIQRGIEAIMNATTADEVRAIS